MLPHLEVAGSAFCVLLAGTAMTQAPNTLTDAERAAGWQLLFDGKTTAGWHGYGKRPFPDGWQVVDGALSRVARGGDIVTDRSFANFELSLEWMVAKAGNSGIFYRGIEADDWRQTPIFHSAPEMQVLDDAGHADGKSPLTSAGSLYGLYPAPPGIVRPAGQWNQVRIVARGSMVEHWLNGTKVVEFDTRSSDFAARVKSSKFAGWPAFATATAGVIGLQDHGDLVRYRSIKIRPL